MNAVKCLLCGDVIVSRYRHEFVTCRCGKVSVDGGEDYIKRAFDNDSKWEELRTQGELDAALKEQAERKEG